MKTLEKVIKEALTTDKYRSGVKEVLQSVKGSKLIILSNTVSPAQRSKIEEQAKAANVALYDYPGTSVQLGKMCNKPFRINAIALKTGSPDEISAILSETSSTPGGR
ncbi:MAG TPA: ribosomal L7Ae/L30e/S12e/Gadd45 family protein [Nitrososphaera sp.]|nr:ribosomal L7Ae/L30e/S12e/Gadd45 family protein [Nitrososphaera sp.]